jgi:hypothetical protein
LFFIPAISKKEIRVDGYQVLQLVTKLFWNGDCTKDYGPELVEGRRFGTVPIRKARGSGIA